MARRSAHHATRVVVADVRGRGESDTPAHGYTWEHHVSDIAAIVAAAALDRVVLVAFSRGSSYALGYALEHSARVRGLVIGDYHARHVGLAPEFVAAQEHLLVRGVPASERLPRHVIEQVQADSRDVPLWDRLGESAFPVLLVRGGRGALVDDGIEARVPRRAPRHPGRAHRACDARPVEPRRRRVPRRAATVPRRVRRGRARFRLVRRRVLRLARRAVRHLRDCYGCSECGTLPFDPRRPGFVDSAGTSVKDGRDRRGAASSHVDRWITLLVASDRRAEQTTREGR